MIESFYSGQPGDVGIEGASGLPGEPGMSIGGFPGIKGDRGPPGPPGLDGLPGPEGRQGRPGFIGLKGLPGDPGRPGPGIVKGEMGEPGEEGMPGLPGFYGMPGPDGQPGAPGINGKDGEPGSPGVPGMPGFSGPKGNKASLHLGDYGIPGPPGLDGLPGKPGERGPIGPYGRPGLDGRPGPRGPKGTSGIPGIIGLPGLAGQKGYPGPPGRRGRDGYPGPRGPDGTPGPEGLPAPPGPPPKSRGYLVTVHSQSTNIPRCPPGTRLMWEGYSLLHLMGDSRTHSQDLGTPGSCLRRFNPMPFLFCNINNNCNYASRNDYSYWLSTGKQMPMSMMGIIGDDLKDYVGRCSVCESATRPIAIHSQTNNLPTCPNGWEVVWHGYSFIMHTDAGAEGGGQNLVSPGSCLQKFRSVPFIECHGHGRCNGFPTALSYWLATIEANDQFGAPTPQVLKGDDQTNRVSRCTQTKRIDLLRGVASVTLPSGDIPEWKSVQSNALQDASGKGDVSSVGRLVKDRNHLVWTRDECGRLPIHYAAYSSRADVIRFFVSYDKEHEGDMVNDRASDGSTPLFLAAAVADLKSVEVLMGEGNANPWIKNEEGLLPIHAAVYNRHSEVVRYFLQYTLEHPEDRSMIDSQDNAGNTPLSLAVLKDDLESVLLLRQVGADVSLANRDGKTPLDTAEAGSKIAEVLGRELTVREKYDVEDVGIGKGAFGFVRTAVNKITRQKVAVKSTEPVPTDETVHREIVNMKKLGELKHDNVVALFEHFVLERNGETSLTLIMELCDQNLCQWLKSHPFEERSYGDITRLLVGLGDGLSYIHGQKIIHRDLHPGNILIKSVDGQEIVKITDFGLSKAVDTGYTSHTERVGHFWYRAPEVDKATWLDSEPSFKYRFKVDVFSAGLVWYELFGDFKFSERKDRLEQARDLKFVPNFAHVFPEEERIIRRMLSKRSQDRPSSMDVARKMKELHRMEAEKGTLRNCVE
ncbi:unnamed protein product, partial [Cyprideis torosa]